MEVPLMVPHYLHKYEYGTPLCSSVILFSPLALAFCCSGPKQARVWSPIFLRVFNNNRGSIIIIISYLQETHADSFVGRRYFRKSSPKILSLYKSPYCTNLKVVLTLFK
ncbi:hypothetical protein BGY98DRAFT_242582 [Russula aff. rugulosa BPL654]|nr:hypothetical protein BGY98DRAFT_242582 [Russula aff. rugulosa BPL654]